MKLLKILVVVLIMANLSIAYAQDDFEILDYEPLTSLNLKTTPFSLSSVGKTFNLPEVDIFKDRFAERPEVDMVAAATKKAYRAKQQQEQRFSFVERQSAIFSKSKPKIDNSSTSPWAPSYHQQPIYSGLNRIKNSAYQDLGDQFRFRSPFYPLSSHRRSSRPMLYLSR